MPGVPRGLLCDFGDGGGLDSDGADWALCGFDGCAGVFLAASSRQSANLSNGWSRRSPTLKVWRYCATATLGRANICTISAALITTTQPMTLYQRKLTLVNPRMSNTTASPTITPTNAAFAPMRLK